MSVWKRFLLLCQMVKIEHSIFALPFAFIGCFLVMPGLPALHILVFLALAMVCVRSYAMAVNAMADIRYDRANPRTQKRPLVTGEISLAQAGLFCALMAAGFVAACAFLNPLCLALSPVALFLAGLYSFSKRFTWLCHFWLGAVLSMAPMGGWLAATGSFALPPILFSLAVIFWVAGFDILYSCQDVAFDREQGLHSVPARFGIPTALALAGFCHVNVLLFLLLGGWTAGLNPIWHGVCAAIALLLFYEHRLVSPEDLTKINLAFFVINGIISVALFCGVLLARNWA